MSVYRQDFTDTARADRNASHRSLWARIRQRPASAERSRFGVLRTGVTLMLAFPFAYAAWMSLVVVFPEAMNAVLHLLFHGLILPRPGESGAQLSFANFATAAGLWAAKGLVFGVVFAVVHNALERWAIARGDADSSTTH